MSLKLLIVGGVAGGASAAAKARRVDEKAEIILFERGEFISFANCGLPYYIGGEIQRRESLLVTNAEQLRRRFRIDVRTFSEVIEIDRENCQVKVKNLKNGTDYYEKYDRLILSPGSVPVKPSISGIDLEGIFVLRNIPDADAIIDYVKTRKPVKAAVIGGGFIGLEMAENLSRKGIEVVVVEMLDQVMAPMDYEMASIIHCHLREKGIDLRLKDGVTSFQKQNERIVVKTSSGSDIECDLVILGIGVKPENDLARNAGLLLGERGCIKVNEKMQTSDPLIYAAGDAVEVVDHISGIHMMLPLAGPANRQGRIAAQNALGRSQKFNGIQGTSIVRVFGMVAACTGNNEKTLKSRNVPYHVSHTVTADHAGYYPGAERMYIKLIFSHSDGKILGCQIVGKNGVDKRIDVIATALKAKMTVFELEELELAYAPPFSSAKDPVNVAGFVASNIIRGDLVTINWNEIESIDRDKCILIDLREQSEIKMSGTIEGSMHIPLNDLRDKAHSLDKEKDYVLFCAVGLRGYLGCRIMMQNGFKCRNLDGGFSIYHFALNGKEKSLVK